MIAIVLGFIVGLVLLVWSADRFVLGASASARLLGVSPLVIGILLVGIGTSAPEMLVSALAAWDGQPGLAVGNALGSNITNIGLIIGVTALFIPLTVRSTIILREIPLLLLVMVAGGLLLWDGYLGYFEGILLLIGFALVVLRQLWAVRRAGPDAIVEELEKEIPTGISLRRAMMWLLVGLLVLLVSARLLVWSAVGIAEALGVSDLIIGLTVVAIGTSLPELAAAIAAARKNEHDIAIGNIIGSNLFNLLGVLALPGIIAPGFIDPAVLSRDYPVMIAFTVLFLIVARLPPFSHRITRLEGGFFLLLYFAYIGWLAVG